jgi:SAM-dependent methyltransferase
LFTHPNASILELGGASGGVATKFLPRRKGVFTNYTYSTPNEAVKQLAEKTLESWKSSLKFTVDDMKGTLPVSEPEERYDIIIAANAFHDAESIEMAMANVRQRLKPGGRLCLIEATKPGVQLSCALGTLQTWWA